MNPVRKELVKKYEELLELWHLASNCQDEKVFVMVDEQLTEVRRELIEAEIKYPTKKEIKRKNKELFFRNRGYDFC